MDPKQILKQVSETIKYGNDKQPNIQKAFMDFNQAVLSPGKLSTITNSKFGSIINHASNRLDVELFIGSFILNL